MAHNMTDFHNLLNATATTTTESHATAYHGHYVIGKRHVTIIRSNPPNSRWITWRLPNESTTNSNQEKSDNKQSNEVNSKQENSDNSEDSDKENDSDEEEEEEDKLIYSEEDFWHDENNEIWNSENDEDMEEKIHEIGYCGNCNEPGPM